MHTHSVEQWQHRHDRLSDTHRSETNTRRVVVIAFCMMVVDIGAGWLYGSMALLADGWHMGTHVAAVGIALYAYRYARMHQYDRRYSFGTG